jgi:hypothetical protein
MRLHDRKRRSRVVRDPGLLVPALVFVSVSTGGFVVLIALLVWSHTLR